MLMFSLWSSGVYIINLKKTWEKLLLAARAIVAIENPADVCVISSRNTGQVQSKYKLIVVYCKQWEFIYM